MAGDLRGAPKVVRAEDHHFADSSEPYLHIVNLATVRAIEREVGRPVDPLRFRPNVIIDDVEPWAEATWVGREVTLGPVRLAVRERTDRCAATNVDPATGVRDMDIPALLMRRWRHVAVGIYAEVVAGGDLAVGDAVASPATGNVTPHTKKSRGEPRLLMISKLTRRSVPRVLDRRGRRRCCTFLGGNSASRRGRRTGRRRNSGCS